MRIHSEVAGPAEVQPGAMVGNIRPAAKLLQPVVLHLGFFQDWDRTLLGIKYPAERTTANASRLSLERQPMPDGPD